MRRVELDAVIPAKDAERVFDDVVRFERYPDLTRHVQSTTVHRTLPEPTGSSSWELHFRSGLLRWTEEETFDRPAGRIDFVQSEGDFEHMSGHWELRADGTDCRLHFQADFDFGIQSMESILDPIAERVIKETVAWVVVGLYPDARLLGDTELLPTTAGAPGTPVAS